MRRDWRVRFLVFGLSTMVTLAVLEGAARWYARFAVAQRTMMIDKTLGWRFIPGTRKRHTVETSYLIQINSHGFRDRDREFKKKLNNRRIVVLGDSFVFGYGGVEYGQRFTDLLESAYADTEVLNLGVPSYSTDQEYLLLDRLGWKYKPDTVVLCVYANDYGQCFKPYASDIGRPKGYYTLENSQITFYPPRIGWFYYASQQSYLIGLVDKAFQASARHPKSHSNATMVPEADRRTVYLRLLSRIKDVCDNIDADLRVVFIPARYEANRRNLLQDLLGEWCGLHAVPYLDIASKPPFDSPSTRSSNYFEVDTHLNVRGNEQVASLLKQFLAE